MEGLSTTKSEPKSLSFLTKGEGEPFIPASICAVVAFGVVTSVYLLGNQPLASRLLVSSRRAAVNIRLQG